MRFFNYKEFIKFTKQLIFRPTKRKRSAKRIIWIIRFYLFFPIWQLIIWSGLILDRIFYPRFKNVAVKEPIFILGNPRSGTTFLHRLLAKDKKNFITMKTWEIFAAPSIIGRKIGRQLANLDRQIGQPTRKQLQEIEYQLHKNNPMHKTGFWQSEEDDYLFIHIWSSLKTWTLSGMLKEAKTYTYFDKLVPTKEKDKILNFYKRCLKRHLFFHQTKNKHYLAKNPNFTPMINSLKKHFPDCKIIYLIRNPLQVVPSFISLTEEQWKVLDDPKNIETISNYALEMAKHWYSYPLQMLDQMSPDDYQIIKLKELAKNTRPIVKKIYQKFNLPISTDFDEKLIEADKKSRQHQSRHKYSIQQMGLTKKEIISQFEKVYDRFKFKKVF